ncbi:MAG: hypothetical protein UIB40_04260 [Paludibacteraceae bacterium]|nr:hypothetical protein [Paludibacteraceae bacterium]
MRNYYNHSKLFLLLGALAIALLIQGVIHLYREVETFGAEHRYTTTHVTYGTHSQATSMPPMVQSPSLRRTAVAVPMANSRTSYTVRHTPSASSSMKIYTTSSAQVRTIGSGVGSGAGGGIATTNGVGSSRRGIIYGGASVSMPTLALATPSMAAEPSMAEPRAAGPRRIQANVDGSYHGQPSADGTQYWDEEKEEWVDKMPIGTTMTLDGKTYEWDGQYWVIVKGTDPYVPVGPTPWLFMAVLAAGYVVVKSGKLKVKSGKLTTDH